MGSSQFLKEIAGRFGKETTQSEDLIHVYHFGNDPDSGKIRFDTLPTKSYS